MQILTYSDRLYLDGECVVALGFFDGVHLGHRDMLARAKAYAVSKKIPLCVFTFSSESEGLKGGNGRIYDTETRLSLLGEAMVDIIVVCDFSLVRDLSPDAFVEEILLRRLHADTAVCGFNFRYGKNAGGNADTLRESMHKNGRECLIVDAFLTEDGEPLSTTKIKGLLATGEMERACAYLGTPYLIATTVEEGLHLGRSYGIPTLNQPFPKDTFLPKSGVYRSVAIVDDTAYHAVTNIGVCPTFGERPIHAETFIVGEGFSLYGKKIKVYLLGYLREEKRFDDTESLKMQILVDKNRTITENGEIQWLATGQN